MAISVRILPDLGLVYIRYSGRMTLAETGAAFADYMAHPEFRPGQKQLVDFTEISEWERDLPKLMELQARKAEAFHDPHHSTMVVAVAPSAETRKLADLVSRSWDAVDGVVYLVAESHDHALDLLGVRSDTLTELFPSI